MEAPGYTSTGKKQTKMRRGGKSHYKDRQDLNIDKKYDSKLKSRNYKAYRVLFYVAIATFFCGPLSFRTIVMTKDTEYENIKNINIGHLTIVNVGNTNQNFTEVMDTDARKLFKNAKDDNRQTVLITKDIDRQAFNINHQTAVVTKETNHQSVAITDIAKRIEKPKLILHVGPFKTASTAIQSILKNKVVRSALLEDKYVVVDFAYRKFQRLLKACFLKPSKESDCSLWHSLINLFDIAYGANNSVILSVETLSRLPINNMTISLWKHLLNQWDVDVILFHRPFDQWVRSLYVQNRKGFMYKSSQGKWVQNFSKGDRERSFPDWFQAHRNSNFEAMRDTIATKAYYDNIFGSSRVHVLDMLAPHGIEIEFLCNNIIRALHGCEAVRKGKVKPRIMNKSAFIISKLDTDLIISEAYRQKLVDLGSQRAVSREKLDNKLVEWNMTSTDLPKACVSQEQEKWLWNRTVFSHKMFSFNRITEEKLHDEFSINRKKFCSVDVHAVLQNSTWREYLSSCEFKNVGCISIESETSGKKEIKITGKKTY